jgi:hypothetical protein
MNSVEQRVREYAAELDRVSTARVAAAPTADLATPQGGPRHRRARVVLLTIGAFGLIAVVIVVVLVASSGSGPVRVAVRNTSSSTGPASAVGDCAGATFDPQGTADGLPYADTVTKSAVDSVLAQNRGRLVTQYGATDLAVVGMVSNAIATLADGGTTITRETIYVIDVTLGSATSCPSAPAFYDGVPLIFRTPIADTPASPTTVPLACVSGISGGAAERPPGITGTLRMIGGPAGNNRPVAGTVSITSATGSGCDIAVSDSGAFDVAVPVGHYTVTGHSPSFGDGQYLCSADGPVNVTNTGLGNLPVTITVNCPVR